ncbi:TonB-dependent receptor [Pseudoduganella lurida]|uniref:TonB-dependent receptor n=1 Tax=Pseudoduganella lurida TaxID=1036180 RepID=A0A562RFD1_9BURK|nr:TonB-dependent receptor [Pseudoduganella lurida]TWI67769.1 TonB-dependent receptor [Pseudoduganella lurida]
MQQFRLTAMALAVAQVALLTAGAARAQTANDGPTATVVVTGQRSSIENAQKIKQNSDEIVDSIVAEDIGKLPDRSVTEVLQRVVGVTIDRTMSRADPEHYSVEGSGVSIRGLSYVRSELNGRDSFSANGGRSLNFEDVPPELMAGLDVYKNPSAEQIEGAIGGLVNLRTALPFDFKGPKVSLSASSTYSELKKGKWSPSGSFLLSNRWKTGIGEIGALLDYAYSESGTRTDALQVEPYYPRNDVVNGQTVWVPKGAQWRTLNFNRKRQGLYGALQWKANADLRSHITFFKSKYEMQWDEQALFAASSPYNIQVANGTFSPNGTLLTGTLSDPMDSGISFGDDTRIAKRKSDTTDISWNVTWRASDQWEFTGDLQRIKAKTDGFDSTVATGTLLPEQQIDLRGSLPNLIFNDAQRAYLANPQNYFWAFTQEHFDRSTSESKALKLDAKYTFEHPVLRDLRFGVRFTKRDAVTELSNPDYNWSPISQTWQLGGTIDQLAFLADPRFSGATHITPFNNFFNGKVNVPALVFPDVSWATGYPDSYAALHKFFDILCTERAVRLGQAPNCAPWTAAAFGGNPAGMNEQSEKTKAAFTQLRFGWDNLKYPVDGNVGVRYVRTEMDAHGYTVYTNNNPTIPAGFTQTGPAIPNIPAFAADQNYRNAYRNVLPSLNLRLKARDDLQFRFAASKAVSRPDFSQLQGYATLNQNVDFTSFPLTQTAVVRSVTQTGEAKGNPMLRPISATQVDLTAEWYFGRASSLTVALFNKRLKDVIVNQSYIYPLPDVNGKLYNFVATGPVNGARGRASGVEIAYQQYFDKLPGAWAGLGVQANYTFVDSSQHLYDDRYTVYCSGGDTKANINLNQNGCDTDGKTFGNLPLQYLSRNAYNLALLYDHGPWSSRLAWSWRSKNLQGVNVNGTRGGDGRDTNPASPTVGQNVVAWALPTWADDYGQLDASLSYQINERTSLGIEAQNLTDSKYKQLMQQGIGMMGRAWFVSGPRYTAQLRYSF